MMHRPWLTLLFVLLSLAAAPAGEEPQEQRGFLGPASLAQLLQLIKPGPGEARWEQIPWLPSSDLWAARQKAAKEDKPLFLWYMAGEPLGPC